MGFFSDLFRTKHEIRPSFDLNFYESVVEKIVKSETLKTAIQEKLAQAFTDSRAFYDDNKNYILSDRGLRYPENASLTPKFVLIDTMQDNGEMAEVDWKEQETEIRTAVIEIVKAKGIGFTISEEDLYEGKNTEEIIGLIDVKELNPRGYCIELLDIQSDSYVFTIIPLTDREEVRNMFEQLKQETL